jgi:hypothetical protein
LLGVNSDADRDVARAAVAKHNINWRSWWVGGTDSAIARQWQVSGWPTIYVIDAQGIIRYRLTSVGELERAIESLLREMEEKSDDAVT